MKIFDDERQDLRPEASERLGVSQASLQRALQAPPNLARLLDQRPDLVVRHAGRLGGGAAPAAEKRLASASGGAGLVIHALVCRRIRRMDIPDDATRDGGDGRRRFLPAFEYDLLVEVQRRGHHRVDDFKMTKPDLAVEQQYHAPRIPPLLGDDATRLDDLCLQIRAHGDQMVFREVLGGEGSAQQAGHHGHQFLLPVGQWVVDVHFRDTELAHQTRKFLREEGQRPRDRPRRDPHHGAPASPADQAVLRRPGPQPERRLLAHGAALGEHQREAPGVPGVVGLRGQVDIDAHAPRADDVHVLLADASLARGLAPGRGNDLRGGRQQVQERRAAFRKQALCLERPHRQPRAHLFFQPLLLVWELLEGGHENAVVQQAHQAL
mmetsp:Transcript_59414/g.181257  ORF Transcript_59414/g.181257 Transcript_59414/m.181257 type:complete len:380 (-) Transcript_59414:1394-2533(-)